MATTTSTPVYTLDEAREMLRLPAEAMLSVEYDDARVVAGGGRNEYWLEQGDDDPVALMGAWRELRAAVARGVASPQSVRVRVRSVSRGIDGHVLV